MLLIARKNKTPVQHRDVFRFKIFQQQHTFKIQRQPIETIKL